MIYAFQKYKLSIYLRYALVNLARNWEQKIWKCDFLLNIALFFINLNYALRKINNNLNEEIGCQKKNLWKSPLHQWDSEGIFQ